MVGVLGEGFFYIGGRKDWKECGGCLLGYREMEMCVRKEEE